MADHLIFIVDADYLPRTATIASGDTVTWENRTGATHTATRTADPKFDTGDIKKGERSKAIPFQDAGDLAYSTKGPGGFQGTLKVT